MQRTVTLQLCVSLTLRAARTPFETALIIALFCVLLIFGFGLGHPASFLAFEALISSCTALFERYTRAAMSRMDIFSAASATMTLFSSLVKSLFLTIVVVVPSWEG